MTNWQRGWLSLDSSENLLRAKRNGSNTQNVWHISSPRMERPQESATFYLSVGHWNQNLEVVLQLGVTKQARRQVLCRTGTSAEKSLQPQAVRDRRALQISHLIQKTSRVCSDVCLQATDSGTDMQLWRFLGRYAQRPTGLWDK